MATEKLIYASAARKVILKADPKLAYAIDNVPAVDAVEVVRCKDCKHWMERDAYGMWTYHQCWITGHIPNEDHFCSYGERKDNERKAD